MKPTLCSRCKKNVAVVFITRLDNNGQGSHNEGLCLKCARELNIRPVTDMIEKMGLSDEELEGLTNEMMSAFEGAESMEGLLGNLSGALSDAANGNDDDEVFIGRDLAHTRGYSEEVAREIDGEISRIIRECHENAESIIRENIGVLHSCAALLLEKEKIHREEFEALFTTEKEEVAKTNE